MPPHARRIVTPEHVEIQLSPAGPGSRFVALAIDSSVTLAASTFLYLWLAPTLPGGLGYALWATLSFVLAWGYHVAFEVAGRGQPPGKRLLGLRVIDGRGLALDVAQSFVRNVLRAVDSLPVFYGVGACALAVDPQRRRLGDLAADTVVVREGRPFELGERQLRAPQFSSLRAPRLIRRIRQRIGVEEREFLFALCLRAPSLEPRARYDLVEQVAAAYRRRLELEQAPMSSESLLRGLAAILSSDRGSGKIRHTRFATASGPDRR